MNCSEVQEVLSAYYDGELASDQRSRLSDHLDECLVCAKQLAGFQGLSVMVSELSTPAAPAHLWSQLERQLDAQRDEQPMTNTVEPSRRSSFAAQTLIALAATVVFALGVGWFTYQSWLAHGEHHQFTAEFRNYLDEFRRDPDAAQQILLAKYSNQIVGPDQAIEQVGYRPAIADGLPAGYAVKSTHVMKMPCCTCVQSLCKRSDGSTLAIFEHDDRTCGDSHCCLVELDDQIAASWQRGSRHITLIGVRDAGEVGEMAAWLDEKERSIPN